MEAEVKNNCIVSQIHIPDYDPQGSLSAADKKEIVDTNIFHLRKYNPDSYIILVGHGHRPYDKTLKMCDHYIWEPLYPLDAGGSVISMPAQYKSVSKGIKHAKENGYEYCLKTRGDSIVSKPKIVKFCHDILVKEEKKILLTQQTGFSLYKFGDCFMYGEMSLIDSIWDLNNSPFHADGLRHTGASFVKHFTGQFPPSQYSDSQVLHNGDNWNDMLRRYSSFRDISTLGFCDLRHNFNKLKSDWDNNKNKILDNTFNFKQLWWGVANGWHRFDEDGKFLGNGNICSWSYNEDKFYGR